MTYQESPSAIQARPEDTRDGRVEAKPRLVLIVEDNELNMKLFRDLLAAYGYATIETRRGMDALDLARQHRPDLILMDIQLPEVSGLEVRQAPKYGQHQDAEGAARRDRLGVRTFDGIDDSEDGGGSGDMAP